MAFNYKTSTLQDLLEHIEAAPSATISVAKAYHTKIGNTEVVDRINYCRSVLKMRRITDQLNTLCSETSIYGINAQPANIGMDRQTQEQSV